MTISYLVKARWGHTWKAIYMTSASRAEGAMAALDALGAVDVHAISCDDERVYGVGTVTDCGSIRTKRLDTPVSADCTVPECMDAPGDIGYPVVEVNRAIRAFVSAGITGGPALDRAWSLANLVAEEAGRDPEEVAITLASIVARGAMVSSDANFLNGGDFDIFETVAAERGTDRAVVVSQTVAGEVSHTDVLDAIHHQLGKGLVY